ncbi:T9SS type A sorting domain-containing protein [Maribacter sp. BPC-D8]|uniref:T9SS type A sorting domain-containing protein n=1 Tax=Maribacter sp. BPC-D8 TaxID=3053613 RepID=UPI002B4AA5BD|nr:T9SS type A sorting domain-containing protein [Maribacter sp. BPC-D8]WRI30606.1 T9SS type A sorting domain-containing protein [Maribacter sp. BPC-D8]
MSYLKKYYKLLILFFLTSLSYGQWQQLPQPEGGFAKDIVEVGSSLFVSSSEGGLYRSDNNADSWYLVSNGLPTGASSYRLKLINDVLYVQIGSSANALYRSDDNGETFTMSSIALTSIISDMDHDGDTIFASIRGGIYISLDNGFNWTFKPIETNGNSIYSLLFIEGKLYKGDNTIQVSEDYGETWEDVDFPNIGPNGINKMFKHNGIVYILNSNKLRYTDASFETFTQIFNPSSSIGNVRIYDDVIYAITHNGDTYQYSNDNGATYTAVNNPLAKNYLSDIYVNNDKILTIGFEGIFESEDAGSTWSHNNMGFLASTLTGLNYDGENIASGFSKRGVVKTSDQGITWQLLNGDLPEDVIKSRIEVKSFGNVILVFTGYQIWKSVNNGQNYTLNYQFDNYVQAIDAVFHDGVILIESKNNQLIISDDEGVSWTTIDVAPYEIAPFALLAFDGQNIALKNTDDKLLVSNDLGLNWSERDFPLEESYVYRMNFHNSKLYAFGNQRLYESSDFGITWRLFGYTKSRHYNLLCDDNAIYMYGDTGISIASYEGNRFYDISENMEGIYINNLLKVNGELYVSTLGYGFWKHEPIQVPADGDNDGVADSDDNCLDTPEGNNVDSFGCSSAELDDDGDGVFNNRDSCENTPAGLEVNSNGCADAELDSDEDGVSNDLDQCPYNTTPGSVINEVGCEMIPVNSISVRTQTTTCPDEQNGIIEISTNFTDVYFYVSVTDENNDQRNYSLTSETSPLTIQYLSVGTYYVNARVLNTDFNNTYISKINTPENVSSGKRNIDTSGKTVTYDVSGSKSYTVQINDIIRTFQFNDTNTNQIQLEISDVESNVMIKGESDCQGQLEDHFFFAEDLIMYPTVTNGVINFENLENESRITLYSLTGKKVFEENLINQRQISIEHLNSGTYVLHLFTNGKTTTYKIIKQ